jgi:HAD superfamily hydrolase (TIGR01456 family)
MQIMSDVLSPHHLQMHPQLNTEENKVRGHIPLYVTNADLVYTTEYRAPRFTQGAFATAFQHLYQTHHGQPLQIEYCGKPFKVQYEYATQLLRQQHQQQQEQQQLQSGHATATGSVGEEVFFGVGDNPLSDIRGANSAGPQWRSVLVRTGVFRDRSKENDAQDPAHYVCEDIREAVDLILAYGGGGHSDASGAFDAAALS